MNEFIFLFQTLAIGTSALVALKLGKEALVAFICSQVILANLFVIKPITLVGLTATGADAFIIGTVFGFHLLQEWHGREIAQKTVYTSFFLMIFYTIASQIHLMFVAHSADVTQPHFQALLQIAPRICLASLAAYFISQQVDVRLYAWLRTRLHGSTLVIRNVISASITQLLDTILFSYLGLYGVLPHINQIITVSYTIKLCALALTIPFLMIARRLMKQ